MFARPFCLFGSSEGAEDVSRLIARRFRSLKAPKHFTPRWIIIWGGPMHFHYAPDDSRIYCSELVFDAYKNVLSL